MKKLSVIIAIFFFIYGSVFAQLNTNNALSRMDSAIELSQEEFTMQDSYFLGRTVAAHILSNFKLYYDSSMIRYLNLICYTLAINTSVPDWFNGYHVMILDDLSVNAFSTSGGHIFLSRGFLDIVTSEDMLASIIAHELAHIQLQHSIGELKHIRFTQQLSADRNRMSRNARGAQNEAFTESIGQMVDALFSRGYSQLQEFEADSAAYAMLAASGYNPDSLIDLLRIIDKTTGNKTAALNTSHPLPMQRIANLEKQKTSFQRINNSAVRTDRFNSIMKRSN